jgi:hypothetical protein
MGSRNLDDARYELKLFADELIRRAKDDLRLIVIVTSVARTYFEQIALVLQGRLSLYNVNLARKIAAMSSITEKENIIVSWTIDSKHIINPFDATPENDKSRAVDFGILDKAGKYQGDIKADTNGDNQGDYLQLGELGMKIAHEMDYPILWGGDPKGRLKGKDLPHWEWLV